MLAVLHLLSSSIVGVTRLQFAMSSLKFTSIAVALAPVPRRHINLLSGQRSVPPAFLKLQKVSSFLFSPAAKMTMFGLEVSVWKCSSLFLSGNHASVKTEEFLLPVSLSARAANNDFQSGKACWLSLVLFLVSWRAGVDGQFNLAEREKQWHLPFRGFPWGTPKIKNQKFTHLRISPYRLLKSYRLPRQAGHCRHAAAATAASATLPTPRCRRRQCRTAATANAALLPSCQGRRASAARQSAGSPLSFLP